MSFETITISVDARGVATLTLNRPEKHNSLSGTMINELPQNLARPTRSYDECGPRNRTKGEILFTHASS